MEWRSGGVDGGLFRADALARPGWYWVFRPRNEGERRYDPQVGILLPVHVRGDERVVSPLADLRDLSPSSLTCLDEDTGLRFGTYYVGPVAYCKHTLARAIAARADKHHHLRVTAIHRERNRHASSDEPWTKTPVAFFTDGRHETRHAITDDQYDQLAAIATDDDYHDHDYIAYNQPIQWHDVFSEDRA